jgi:PPM family protein phosphatase
MRVRRSAGLTDTGRKRRRNEDAFVCEPPLFAVADGMGGAQAGEMASRLAAAALREGDTDGDGEERVAELIREANRRVYERSAEDASVQGMGTTMTVALVGAESVAIGHVGDSRAYLVRDGALEQITQDHSLVAELVRSGKLSPEEAERHPQRNVITRVLGSDPDVDVDAFSVAARDGDLFMLCSDGLTSMVDEDAILGEVERNRGDLRRAAKALVEAANRSGGEDNITVILFEVAEGSDDTATMPAIEEPEPEGQADDEDTLTGLEVPPGAYDPDTPTADQLDEWLELDGDEEPHDMGAPPRRRSWAGRHPILLILAALAVVGIAFALALWGLSDAHFVGARSDGRVAIYQGVPFDITNSVHLYREVYVSPVFAAQLSQAERRRLFAHDLRSYDSALAAIRPFERSADP